MAISEIGFHNWIEKDIPRMCLSENEETRLKAKKIYIEWLKVKKYPSKYSETAFRKKYGMRYY
jgi:hypothetical protein